MPQSQVSRHGTDTVPEAWRPIVGDELTKPYYHKLHDFLAAERQAHAVYPPEPDIFNALRLTPYADARVLILGQDPYHDEGQAHGLAFSVRPGVKPPPSLVNIFKELRDDLGCRVPNNGDLTPWSAQGILLLNSVLTVRAHSPASHRGKGWEIFTDTVIRAVAAREDPIVFVLWGAFARKKRALIDTGRHTIVESAHPSPLSAHAGFFGSRPFSTINNALQAGGKGSIDWQIPD